MHRPPFNLWLNDGSDDDTQSSTVVKTIKNVHPHPSPYVLTLEWGHSGIGHTHRIDIFKNHLIKAISAKNSGTVLIMVLYNILFSLSPDYEKCNVQ